MPSAVGAGAVRRCAGADGSPAAALPGAGRRETFFDGGRLHALVGWLPGFAASGKAPGQQSRLVQICRARPFLMLVLLGLFPHLIGSIVNILYNQQLIVNKDETQQACFHRLVLAYNSVVYPLIVITGIVVIRRVLGGLARRRTGPACAGCERAHPPASVGVADLDCRFVVPRLVSGGHFFSRRHAPWLPGRSIRVISSTS